MEDVVIMIPHGSQREILDQPRMNANQTQIANQEANASGSMQAMALSGKFAKRTIAAQAVSQALVWLP